MDLPILDNYRPPDSVDTWRLASLSVGRSDGENSFAEHLTPPQPPPAETTREEDTSRPRQTDERHKAEPSTAASVPPQPSPQPADSSHATDDDKTAEPIESAAAGDPPDASTSNASPAAAADNEAALPDRQTAVAQAEPQAAVLNNEETFGAEPPQLPDANATDTATLADAAAETPPAAGDHAATGDQQPLAATRAKNERAKLASAALQGESAHPARPQTRNARGSTSAKNEPLARQVTGARRTRKSGGRKPLGRCGPNGYLHTGHPADRELRPQ